MRYLTVRNWAQFQHYNKRNPPWIKLHRAIVDDYNFSALKDRTKGHLFMIWILASATEGRVPHDPKFIAQRIGSNEPLDLHALIDGGFLLSDGAEDEIVNQETGEIQSPKPKPARPIFAPPEWIIREQWDSWVAIRPAKARTPASLEAAVGKLEKFKASGHDPNAIVANSLANGWQGLFPPDVGGTKTGTIATGNYGRCHYCTEPATRMTNSIPHCGRANHIDFAKTGSR